MQQPAGFLCPSTPPRITNATGFADNYPSSDPCLKPVQPSSSKVIRLSERRPASYSYSAFSPVVVSSPLQFRPLYSFAVLPPRPSVIVPTQQRLPPRPAPVQEPASPSTPPLPTPSAAETVVASPDRPLGARERAFREAEERLAGFIARNREEDARRQAQLTARSRDPVAAASDASRSPAVVKYLVEHPMRAVEKISLEKFRQLQNSRKLMADQHAIGN